MNEAELTCSQSPTDPDASFRVYTRSAGVWSQQGPKPVGTGAVAPFGAQQGYSVSLSGDVPAVPPSRARAPAATAGFSIPQGEIPRETDCLLEEDGFELVWGFPLSRGFFRFIASSL